MLRPTPSAQLVIIDDDPHVLNALRFAFEVDGYDVQTHMTGEAALAELPLRAACIIIDENLPGASGVQTASLMRGKGVTAPMILITTNPSARVRSRALQSSMDVVEKPLICDALARKVKQLTEAPVTGKQD